MKTTKAPNRGWPHPLRNMLPKSVDDVLTVLLSLEVDDVAWRSRVSWRKFATLEEWGLIDGSPPRLTDLGVETLALAREHPELGLRILHLLEERARLASVNVMDGGTAWPPDHRTPAQVAEADDAQVADDDLETPRACVHPPHRISVPVNGRYTCLNCGREVPRPR